jgi:hypothetical protein
VVGLLDIALCIESDGAALALIAIPTPTKAVAVRVAAVATAATLIDRPNRGDVSGVGWWTGLVFSFMTAKIGSPAEDDLKSGGSDLLTQRIHR